MTDSTNTPETPFSFYRQRSLEDSILFLLRCSYLNDCKTYEQYIERFDKTRALRELAAQYEIDKAAIVERAAKESAPHNTDAVREALAAYAHKAWSGWMRYLFKKSHKTAQGTMTIPNWAVARWTKQMETKYADLPDDQKPSDRDEADKILAIVVRGAEIPPLQNSSSTSDGDVPLAVLETGSREIGSVVEISGEQRCRPLEVLEPFWIQTHGGMAQVFEHGIYELSLFGKRATVNQGIGDMTPEQTIDNIKLEAQQAVEDHEAEQAMEEA